MGEEREEEMEGEGGERKRERGRERERERRREGGRETKRERGIHTHKILQSACVIFLCSLFIVIITILWLSTNNYYLGHKCVP